MILLDTSAIVDFWRKPTEQEGRKYLAARVLPVTTGPDPLARTGRVGLWKGSLLLIACSSCMALLMPAGVARGDWWVPARTSEYSSTDRKHVFKVLPAGPSRSRRKGVCRGELYEVNGKKRTLVWSRTLMNEVSPVQCIVTDSGKYVITLDEWERYGVHPLVIYGAGGQLIRDHTVETLRPAGWRAEVGSNSGPWWLRNSMVFFGPTEQVVCVRLEGGWTMILDLASGRPLDQAGRAKLNAHVVAQTRSGALAMLRSGSTIEWAYAAKLCGRMKLREAIPRLKELDNKTMMYSEVEFDTPDDLRRAVRAALRAMGEKVKPTPATRKVTKARKTSKPHPPAKKAR